MVLEKRKKNHVKSGTKRSLFRLRLRLLHAVLDVILIVCLVVFAVVWLVLNDWDCLISLWKKSCVVLLHESILLWFSPWCFIWVDLAHAYNMFDSNKLPYSLYDYLVFWLVIPHYALVYDVLSLRMIMTVIALLVGRS
jgi:hypothetical protein